MFMTASRMKIDGNPALKLNLHEFGEEDIAFLDSLGIDIPDEELTNVRYKLVHSQEDFLSLRATILEKYNAEEKGPRVFLEPK